jgi:hypothetical protein
VVDNQLRQATNSKSHRWNPQPWRQ